MADKNLRPFALYVHWPFCRSKCPYCDFNSHVRERVDQDAWREALLAELSFHASRAGGRELSSIFFGGGTPSLMPPETVAAIIEAAGRHFRFAGDVEITLEANPTSVEAEKFKAFASAGVNRLSLGVQSLEEKALKFLGREHSAGEAVAAIGLAAQHFPRYSFDLIYARPGQDWPSWEAELEAALAHAGGHLSLYQLTIEENTAFHHLYHHEKRFALPDEEQAAELYQRTSEFLAVRGFAAYEVSNYAKPGEESRHNLAYWQSDDYLGIGPGAHGRYRVDGTRVATQNIKSPERWLEQVRNISHGMEMETVLTSSQQAEEWVMMGLRLAEGIEKARAPAPFDRIVLPSRRALYQKQGLLEEGATHLRATARGRLLLNVLTAELLA